MEPGVKGERPLERGFKSIHDAWARCSELAEASEASRRPRRWLLGVRRQRVGEGRFDWVIVAVPRAE